MGQCDTKIDLIINVDYCELSVYRRMSYFGIMSQWDAMFDSIMKVGNGESDLTQFSDCLISRRLFDGRTPYFGTMSQ